MICLTGDVYNTSLMTNDQKCIADPDLTEIQITRMYVELLEKYDVRCTLYICGRAFTEEWDDLKPMAAHPLVEIGGNEASVTVVECTKTRGPNSNGLMACQQLGAASG